MARIPYVTAETASEQVRETLRALPAEAGIFTLVAHAETCLRPFLLFGQAILTALQLDPRLRELAILHSARLSGVDYEWVQHVRLAQLAGVTEAQLDALRAGETEAAVFTDTERRVLAFTGELVRTGDASDAGYARLAERLGAREIVELTLTIGFYRMLGGLMNVTRIDPEPPVEVRFEDLA